MEAKDKEPTKVMADSDCWRLTEMVGEYGLEAVILTAEGMVKK
jgi:hypothetical protein